MLFGFFFDAGLIVLYFLFYLNYTELHRLSFICMATSYGELLLWVVFRKIFLFYIRMYY